MPFLFLRLYLSVLFAVLVRSVNGDALSSETTPIAFNATVSLRPQPGVFNSIGAALASSPTNSIHRYERVIFVGANPRRYYIHVEAGIYKERVVVPINLINIVLIGDGAQETRVQWNRHAPVYGTDQTATLTVNGDGFNAKFMAFENTTGPGFQAAAVMTTSVRTAYYKCAFLGYQDTLYAKEGQHFYKECDIYGTIDFIFGGAAAVFQSCNLYALPNQPVVFMAQKKVTNTEPKSGFVIQDCRLVVALGVKANFTAYLGRPWSTYAVVVVMESYLDTIIQPQGWEVWDNTTNTNLVTYREFNNRGPGAGTAGRVRWSGYVDETAHPDKVLLYTVQNFINIPEWLGETGIPFSGGFIYNNNHSIPIN